MSGHGCFFDGDLLGEVRDRFANVDSDPFSGKRIYFENAGGTLRLKSILATAETFTALPDNAGRRNKASEKVDQVIAQGRVDIALFLGARSGQIAAEQSTTGMIFRILNTIANNAGTGNLVTTNLDHAASFDANKIVAKRCDMEFRYCEFDPQTGLVSAESIRKVVDKKSVALTVIHASNILGSTNDVASIAGEARKINPDIFIVVDGAQYASHGKVDVEVYGADAWIFVPYKTYSKVGTSFAWLSDRLASLPHDNLLGKPKSLWDLGTREAAAYACMSKVVDYFRWLGSKFTQSTEPRTQIEAAMLAIEGHEAALLKALLRGTDQAKGMLQMDHVTVYPSKEDLDRQEVIVAFNVKGRETVGLVDYFEQNGVRLHNRISDAYSRHTLSALGIEQCVRVSLCHYNTLAEVNIFLQLLQKAAK